jgi:hypothetical protein
MQMKFENYVICQYLMISYVKDVVKFLMSFEKFIMYDAYKLKHPRISFIELRRVRLGLK